MRYELYYWPSIQGRGEFVRLALEEAAADYVDVAREKGGTSRMMRLMEGATVAAPPLLAINFAISGARRLSSDSTRSPAKPLLELSFSTITYDAAFGRFLPTSRIGTGCCIYFYAARIKQSMESYVVNGLIRGRSSPRSQVSRKARTR